MEILFYTQTSCIQKFTRVRKYQQTVHKVSKVKARSSLNRVLDHLAYKQIIGCYWINYPLMCGAKRRFNAVAGNNEIIICWLFLMMMFLMVCI